MACLHIFLCLLHLKEHLDKSDRPPLAADKFSDVHCKEPALVILAEHRAVLMDFPADLSCQKDGQSHSPDAGRKRDFGYRSAKDQSQQGNPTSSAMAATASPITDSVIPAAK